jgi:hypothetical protein
MAIDYDPDKGKPEKPKPTKCPSCGHISVAYTQQAWGDKWDCTYPNCSYTNYYSLGD